MLAAPDSDIPLPARRAALPQRAGLAVASRELGNPLTDRASAKRSLAIRPGLVDRRGLALGAGDRVGLKVDRERLLGDRPVLWRGAVDRREHRDRALLELLADLDVAVGGVPDHPLRMTLAWLLVNQGPGVLAVVLVRRRERDRGQDRRLGRRMR